MRRRRASAASVVAAAAVLMLLATPAGARFSGTTVNPGVTVASDVLDGPTSLSASRPCVAPAPWFAGSSQASTTASSVMVARPAAQQAGDVVIAVVTTGGAAGVWSNDGWSTQAGSPYDGAMVFIKQAGASEPASYTFDGLIAAPDSVVMIAAYRAAAQSSPWSGFATMLTTASATASAPQVTASKAGTILNLFAVPAYSGSVTPQAGLAARATISGAGNRAAVVLADAPIAQGASHQGSATLTAAASSQGIALVLYTDPSVIDSSVHLSWTATGDVYATGYRVGRAGAGPWLVAGPSATGYTDATLGSTSAATYWVESYVGAWTSARVSVNVGAC